MDFISNISDWNRHLKEAEGDSRVLILNEIDRVTKEKSDLVDYINELKKKREPYVKMFNNKPPIPVPPNSGYDIDNGLISAKRDILLKQTRNPHLTDVDLQQIMGINPRTVIYTNHFLFKIEIHKNLIKSSTYECYLSPSLDISILFYYG
jgi:hypothetical protein